MAVRCGLLGPLLVSVDGRQVHLGGVKERSVLVLLVLRARQVVSNDYLIDRLWGEHPPASATNTLQTYISRLRKALHGRGDDVLITRRPGYVLEIPDEDIDVRRFEHLVRSGQRALADGRAADSADLLRRALELWRGPALGDVATEEFAVAEIRILDEMRLTALETRIRADLELGRHREVIYEAEALVREHPLREGPWASLMLALYRDGRQAEALRVYQEARRSLAEELGIDPGPELRQLEDLILHQDPSLLREPPAAEQWSGNLQADLTSFVGRANELADLEHLVRQSRIVTLLGPGGIGKSRLALELARRLEPEFDDGAWLVDLGATSESQSTLDEIAALWPHVDRRPNATVADLARLLGDRQALLLLDNCERAAAGAAPVTEQLLAAAPSLRVLATSREPLECRGEVLWRVSSLGLPEAGTIEMAAASDAVELFVARARDAVPGFTLAPDNAATVARICARLEGIPLAIELAASRLRGNTLDELAVLLDDRFGLLVGSGRTVPHRQRTLQRTIEWSYDLLEPAERALFGRLGIFWGEFPVRAIEVVNSDLGGSDASLVPLVDRLADKSLVVRIERRDRTWYRVLDTIRAFAFRKFTGSEEIHQRGFLIRLAARTDRNLVGSVDQMWADLLAGSLAVARESLTVAANSFREEHGGELAGGIAALVSGTRRIAFLAGVSPGPDLAGDRRDAAAGIRGHMRRFHEGFHAGALGRDPDIDIVERYLSDDVDFAGAFENPALAGDLAAELFADDVDVVFHAAGDSGRRIFEMARRATEDTGTHRWVIGVDFDQHQDLDETLRPHVLASIRKQVPMDVFREIKRSVAQGRPDEAPWFGLANGGIVLSTSGGHLTHLADRLTAMQAEIIARDGPAA